MRLMLIMTSAILALMIGGCSPSRPTVAVHETADWIAAKAIKNDVVRIKRFIVLLERNGGLSPADRAYWARLLANAELRNNGVISESEYEARQAESTARIVAHKEAISNSQRTLYCTSRTTPVFGTTISCN